MEFSKRVVVLIAIMYYLGLFSERTPTQVEVCYHSKMKTRISISVPARELWDECVEDLYP